MQSDFKDQSNNITMSDQADLPSEFGTFTIVGFLEHGTGKEHSAIMKGRIEGEENVPCRIHSECHTGDVLGSLRCDCRKQLELALRYIEEQGKGVLVYLRQEGRGIGLINKINAYRLQQDGLDTVEANVELGLPPEARNYAFAASVLKLLKVKSISLISNNPAKFEGLKKEGIVITSRIPVAIESNAFNREYLNTKQSRLHHQFNDSKEVLGERHS
ncbi:MAG: GTP cyclohydrolase II [Spirochaeta sp. LUC14_002_19_P3]|nr:MAG: GTP cyclohydrolase II [Spirochaeta sp. LUC14_002_19_P3]